MPIQNDEAARLLSVTTQGSDLNVDRSLGNVFPFRDIMLSQDPVSCIFKLPTGLSGLALTGWLPPGAAALVFPESSLGTLATIAPDAYSAAYFARGADGFGIGDNALILRAGDAVAFGRKLQFGLAGVFFTPWDSSSNARAAQGAANPFSALAHFPAAAVTGQLFMSETGCYGPAASPIMRCFFEVAAVPKSIGYTRVPLTVSIAGTPTSKPATNFTAGPGGPLNFLPGQGSVVQCVGVAIPPGTRELALAVSSDTGTNVPGTYYNQLHTLATDAIAAFDINVAWVLGSGISHVNPSDQWTATGRGQASGTHDVEAYQVPGNAVGIDIWTPGTSRHVHVIMSEG